MSASGARGANRRPLRRIGMGVLAAATLLAPATAARAAEKLNVVLDQAQIVKLPPKVGTIVIGNPLIADATIQAGGLLVVTGKSYGTTNLVALDRAGNVLADKLVQVRGPGDVVVVHRGVDRESYSCAPNCEQRITLGDTNAYFQGTMAQTVTRNGQAATAGQSSR